MSSPPLLQRSVVLLALGLAALPGGASAQTNPRTPYWASIKSSEATMRRGPSRDMRAMWTYRRPGLPVQVVAVMEDWRQVREPDGTIGWMHRSLLSGRGTAIVVGSVQPMRTRPDPTAGIAWRAAPGVVGTIERCDDGWCLLDVTGRRGWVARAGLWGAVEE